MLTFKSACTLAFAATAFAGINPTPDCVTTFAGILGAPVFHGANATVKAFTLTSKNQVGYVGDGASPLVVEFQQSPAAEEALYIMSQSYDRLGLTQLRDDADRVLRSSFPNSTIRTGGLTQKKSAWWQFW